MPIRFLGHGSANPLNLLKLIRLIRERNVDVVHLTDFGASTYGRIAAKLTHRPVIVHVRSHHSEYQPRGFPRLVEMAYRVLAPLTDRAIAISRTVMEFAIERMGFVEDQVQILNNPLANFSFSAPEASRVAEVRRRHGIPDGAPVVGTVTRFHEAKGIKYLLDAFPPILSNTPEARLVLVGEGPLEGSLRAQAERLGITDRVIFAGFQREVELYFCLFDVSVVPSLEEGFGNVAVESMAMGVPVVASRVGGLPEIVQDGETGFLVDAANPPEIGRRVGDLLRDPDLRRRLGQEAKTKSRRFAMGDYIQRLEIVYRDVAKGNPK